MSSNQFARRKFMKDGLIAGEAAALALWMGSDLLAAEQPLIIDKHKDVCDKIAILGGRQSQQGPHRRSMTSPKSKSPPSVMSSPTKWTCAAQLIKSKTEPGKYTDMDKMLQQADLDAVAVVLPNYLHKMATVAARLEAGKHVFCEKPMALTVADCNEMIAAADRKQKAIQIGTQRRHSPAFQKAVETIRNSPVGKILSSDVNSYRGDWRRPRSRRISPRRPLLVLDPAAMWRRGLRNGCRHHRPQ